eukprot:278381-Chlamydomonas_euryale.AAC.14
MQKVQAHEKALVTPDAWMEACARLACVLAASAVEHWCNSYECYRLLLTHQCRPAACTADDTDNWIRDKRTYDGQHRSAMATLESLGLLRHQMA